MDKVYFLEDILQPDPMKFADEFSEFDHDTDSANRSLSLQMMETNPVRSPEKRAHERFQARKDAFALIRPPDAGHLRIADRSMAQIACAVYRSKPVRFGRIIDISMGGLLFYYINGKKRPSRSLVLDILVADSGFYLENLLFKNIADVEITDDFTTNSFNMRLNQVQFEGLKPVAMMKLKYFVENYTVPRF
ncbi:MAG: hypothetical protein WBY47_10010 [Desulfobacterales bacterium]|jgi:hypothetical protein